ncbi:hypothetical protein TKK_0002791 [Trichogramma kaykai]
MNTTKVAFYSFTLLSEASLLAYLLWKQWRRTGHPLPSLHAAKEIYLRWKRHRDEKNEMKNWRWHKVGEVDNLIVYPVRSMRGIRLDSAYCHRRGLCHDEWLRDRYFAVVDLSGYYVDPDKDRKIRNIQPCMMESILVLTYTHRDGFMMDLSKLKEGPFELRILADGTLARDCGDEVAQWLSRYLRGMDTSFRLVTWPSDDIERRIWKKFSIFNRYTIKDTGAFGDGTSYTLENKASVDDLNTLLFKPVNVSQLMPNIVVSGPKAYDEDSWETVRIGECIFQNVMPCGRDHDMGPHTESGRKKELELRSIMRRYRFFLNHEVENVFRGFPSIGIHLGLRYSGGLIRKGDPVYVRSDKKLTGPMIKTNEKFRNLM